MCQMGRKYKMHRIGCEFGDTHQQEYFLESGNEGTNKNIFLVIIYFYIEFEIEAVLLYYMI